MEPFNHLAARPGGHASPLLRGDLRRAGRLARSSQGILRSTTSRSTGRLIDWSTKARQASSTARAPRAISRSIAREHHRFWGTVPYDSYVCLNLITESGGGLEHASSAVLMTSRWATRTRKAYLGWLELASHEFFHVWNGKRLRPIELGPFDYEREAHTRGLWVVEGMTDYYGDVLLHRAGLSTRDEFLASLSDKIEGAANDAGASCAITRERLIRCLDQTLSSGRELAQHLHELLRQGRGRGVSPRCQDSSSLARGAKPGRCDASGVLRGTPARADTESRSFAHWSKTLPETSLETFWSSALDGTAELDYSEALDTLGLRFKTASRTPDGCQVEPRSAPSRKPTMAGLIISHVWRGTAAHEAGLNVDDEIVAIDEFRVRADQLDARMEQYVVGDRVSILVARRDRLMRLDMRLGSEPLKAWQLEVDPGASAAQRKTLDFWLAQSGNSSLHGLSVTPDHQFRHKKTSDFET